MIDLIVLESDMRLAFLCKNHIQAGLVNRNYRCTCFATIFILFCEFPLRIVIPALLLPTTTFPTVVIAFPLLLAFMFILGSTFFFYFWLLYLERKTQPCPLFLKVVFFNDIKVISLVHPLPHLTLLKSV